MRSMLSFVTVALCAAASSPAAAQHIAAAEYVRPVVVPATPSTDAIRTVAIYRFEASRVAGIPSHVTVADSAGTLIASFRLPGAREPRPMSVETLDSDLVLQGWTPSGVLTLVLHDQNDGAPSSLVGRWILGTHEGELRGRAAR